MRGVASLSNAFAMATLPPKSQRTYSTTKQWTGEYWIDGKPIYRKVIATTFPNSSKLQPIGESVDTIVSLRGIKVAESGEHYMFMGNGFPSSGKMLLIVVAYNNTEERANSIEIVPKNDFDAWVGQTVYLIVEFTLAD